jgi:hypothetical protein
MSSPRRVRLVAGGALLVVGLGIWVGLALSGGPGGDSGGVILQEMKASLTPAAAILPKGSQNIEVQSVDARWHGKCDGLASEQTGWTKIRVTVSFVSAESSSTVANSVRHGLDTRGWRLTGPSRWKKELHDGTVAHVSLFRMPGRVNSWGLSGTAEPPGYAPTGC